MNDTHSANNLRLIPFVIAVTGHRSIAREGQGAVLESARSVLRHFRAESGLSTTPVVLLSALAEGADQLVAECALELGISLIAVLPFSPVEYSQTMSQSAAENMRLLITRCDSVIQLPPSTMDSTHWTVEAIRVDAYRRVGMFLAENCQALLALWDGVPPDRPGGTAEVVDSVLSGWIEETHGTIFKESQTGVVFHVVTPRENQKLLSKAGCLYQLVGMLDEKSGKRETRTFANGSKSPLFRLLQNMESYNLRASNLPQTEQDEKLLVGLEESAKTDFLKRVASISACADAISREAAGRRHAFLKSILATGAAATLGYAVVDEVFHEKVLLWLVLPLLLLVALGLHKLANRGKIDDLYLDCRALSESLRVQFFWEMGCVQLSAADFYLPHQALEIDWIRSALRSIYMLRSPEGDRDCSKEAIDFVMTKWIQDQRTWYISRSIQQERYVARRDRASRTALLVAIGYSLIVPLLLTVHLTGEWAPHAQEFFKSRPWYDLLHLPAVVATVMAGAIRIWTDQLGFVEQAREYRRIGNYLRQQSRRIVGSDFKGWQIREILISIGKEALEENGRWLILHRERPLEVDAA